jgi:hypothetical protein
MKRGELAKAQRKCTDCQQALEKGTNCSATQWDLPLGSLRRCQVCAKKATDDLNTKTASNAKRLCSDCETQMPKTAFTPSEWKKKIGNVVCKVCKEKMQCGKCQRRHEA